MTKMTDSLTPADQTPSAPDIGDATYIPLDPTFPCTLKDLKFPFFHMKYKCNT
jgi:hypothetical protein